MDNVTLLIIAAAVLVFLALAPTLIFGLVVIDERSVGIVIKKFSTKSLVDGALIATNGESGYQADTLSPGWHFGYFLWQYQILKIPLTVIPTGEIGLIVAKDGRQIPSDRILGQTLECDNFQNARKFLTAGGEKGRQIGILTAGQYRINTALFTVITSTNATTIGLIPEDLEIFNVDPDQVGIVTTLDGRPLPQGEIAGATVDGHENFQNANRFIAAGGYRGLQEQVLLSGSWNINPWFANVQSVQMTSIPIGYVGVVISFVGREHLDISGIEFKHGDLVDKGHKGVWAEPLYPGKHPINTKCVKVELVPTTNIALNWANDRSESHQLDEKLSSIKVRSRDGFSFVLDVAQIIHVGAREASKVISRFGSMANLVNQVLEPAIGNYFRNSAQNFTVLDFLGARTERQKDALGYIREALREYDVEAVDTYIGDIVPPEALMQTQTERKIAEEQKKTYEIQEAAQKQRQTLVKEQSLADIQGKLVEQEQNIRMQDFQAQSAIKRAEGEARSVELKAAGDANATQLRAKADSDALRMRGEGEARAVEAVGLAKAKAYEAGIHAMGKEIFGQIQIVQTIGDKQIRVTPEFLIQGGANGDGNGALMIQALLANMIKNHPTTVKAPEVITN
ncbi:SPFH domain-containing protein [soil metagenome]